MSQVIASERCDYFNALKLMIQNSVLTSTCYGTQINVLRYTAEGCTAAFLCQFYMNIKETKLFVMCLSSIRNPRPFFNTLTAADMHSCHNWQKLTA